MNRRRFLEAASAFPFLSAPSLPPADAAPTQSPSSTRPSHSPWIEISRANLSFNIARLSETIGRRPILAVLKNNAYGVGLIPVARHLETIDAVGGYAVFKIDEAIALRDAGLAKQVVLFGPAAAADIEELARRDIEPAIFTDQGAALDRAAERLGRPVSVHLYIDTGLGRLGVQDHLAAPLIESLAARRGVRFAGAMTALTEDDAFDVEQVRRFNGVVERASAAGVDLGVRHVASSDAIFDLPESWLDRVRPGIAIYGAYPTDRAWREKKIELRPVAALKAPVVYVKQLRPGDTLQYGRAYKAERPVWIATLPVGYTDGWPPEAAGKCSALIGGRRYPVVAMVTSNHALVEIGDEPTVKVGDVALLHGFGEGEASGVNVHEVAEQTGDSVYRLLMRLGAGLPRIAV
jgi:alanine racemase